MFLISRWTDNIFSIQEWVKRKFPSIDQVSKFEIELFLQSFFILTSNSQILQSGLSKQFGVPDDLDYMEL